MTVVTNTKETGKPDLTGSDTERMHYIMEIQIRDIPGVSERMNTSSCKYGHRDVYTVKNLLNGNFLKFWRYESGNKGTFIL